ncbi:TetR/AcrR family transcriptional regulator C-terminal domain-containing protein [Nocardia salmonicida]|nr:MULTISPECIES: TetR/AcrR family transcriptional regulator C-terminal domain-containing protein [Nocardia]
MDRVLILESAIALIDEEGLAHLTMRRLGSWLGVEAMALYRYVSGRDDLLAGVVDHLVDQLYDQNLMEPDDEGGSWQGYLQRLAHGVRRVAIEHPEVFPLMAASPPQAPWLCPPLRSLNWMESFLETMLHYGFDDRQAVQIYRSFATFLLGHLLLEVATMGVELSPIATAEPGQHESSDLADYPHVYRLQRQLAANRAADEFEESLEALLDRLEAMRRARQSP